MSGFFVDRSASLSTAHNTGFAIGAMNLLRRELRDGELPKAPLRFAQQVREPADAERFAASLDWRNDCYEAGENLIGHASSFFNVAGAIPRDWFAWLVEFVEGTKLDEANGMVGVGKPPGGDTDQIGGTLHFDFFWAALGRQLPVRSGQDGGPARSPAAQRPVGPGQPLVADLRRRLHAQAHAPGPPGRPSRERARRGRPRGVGVDRAGVPIPACAGATSSTPGSGPTW